MSSAISRFDYFFFFISYAAHYMPLFTPIHALDAALRCFFFTILAMPRHYFAAATPLMLPPYFLSHTLTMFAIHI